MKQMLVTVSDKARIHELEQYGCVTYVSNYTNLIGIECHEKRVDDLTNDQLVIEYEDACTGTLI